MEYKMSDTIFRGIYIKTTKEEKFDEAGNLLRNYFSFDDKTYYTTNDEAAMEKIGDLKKAAYLASR